MAIVERVGMVLWGLLLALGGLLPLVCLVSHSLNDWLETMVSRHKWAAWLYLASVVMALAVAHMLGLAVIILELVS